MLRKFVEAGGVRTLCVLSVFLTLAILTQAATNIWLRLWSDDPVYENPEEARDLVNLRLGVYGSFGIVQGRKTLQL